MSWLAKRSGVKKWKDFADINLYFDLIRRSSDKLENGENIFC